MMRLLDKYQEKWTMLDYSILFSTRIGAVNVNKINLDTLAL